MSATTSDPPDNPLSRFRVTDGWIHTAGQVGIAPGASAPPESFEEQVRVAVANLERALQDGGGSLATVEKTTLLLVRRADFAAMNEIYAELFPQPYPARSTIVCDLVRAGLLFEIEAVARVAEITA